MVQKYITTKVDLEYQGQTNIAGTDIIFRSAAIAT